MTDAHTHIGQYYDLYTNPEGLVAFLDLVGVSRFAVSSTTTCEENYSKVISEIKGLIGIVGERVIPVLWITPEMIRSWEVFSMFDQGIDWKCLKIHPQLHPTEWLEGSVYTSLVAAMAAIKGIPLLIHTGETEGCYPRQYEWIIKTRPDVTFILAHGRPIGQTIELMNTYPNVWCDTAFMPTENIVKLCEAGLADRVLWGTDYPIIKHYYPDTDMREYYIHSVKALERKIDSMAFDKITGSNFMRLFNISSND